MALIDTHTHLETFARNGTLNEALARTREAGVDSVITVGTAPDDWELYRGIAAERRTSVNYTVGLHPCSVDGAWEPAVAQIEAFWRGDTRPVALGECGLDRFHLPKDEAKAAEIFAWQRAAFDAQLVIVKRLGC